MKKLLIAMLVCLTLATANAKKFSPNGGAQIIYVNKHEIVVYVPFDPSEAVIDVYSANSENGVYTLVAEVPYPENGGVVVIPYIHGVHEKFFRIAIRC